MKFITTALRAIALFFLVLVLQGIYYFAKRDRYPIVGKSIDHDFRRAIKEGVAKLSNKLQYPNTPFYLPSKPPTLILPKSAIQDIKSFTEKQASFSAVINHEFYPKITGIGSPNEIILSVVKNDISRNIAVSLADLQDEVVYSFNKRFGLCEDWTSFVLYPELAKIVSLVSNRVFVGLPLSRNEEWVDVNINYTLKVSVAKKSLKNLPPMLAWAKNIVSYFLEDVQSLRRFRKRASELLKPIVEAQLAKDGNEKLYCDERDEQRNAISWILARMKPGKQRSLEVLTDQLLGLSFAAIHTTTFTLSQVIFDLATYHQYIPILTDEIENVMAEDGYDLSEDGVRLMRKSSMPKLAKLDSFIKESQRVNPLGLISHNRETVSDVTLSTGHKILKATRIAFPSWYVHNESSALHLPGHTKPLHDFDGLRFYNLRKIPGNENRHQFVSTSPDSLSFGYGNHVCPGRFFSSNEIKIILIELLCSWELRFPGAGKLEDQKQKRPKKIFSGLECLPNTKARIEFRRKRC